MSSRFDVSQQIMKSGIIAIIRVNAEEKIEPVADALALGGVCCIEVPVTVPGALSAIRKIAARSDKNFFFGAGSVLDAETAGRVIEAGADFIVAPNFNAATLHTAHRYGKVMIPGAFTPTEIITAYEQGADFVKVFPASLGGPAYIRELKAPMPQVRLIPTGGANRENAGLFFAAGAAGVGMGSALIDPIAVDVEDYTAITQNAIAMVEAVQKAKAVL